MSTQTQKERVCARCGRVIPPQMRWKLRRGWRWKGPMCQRCTNALSKAKGYASERQLVQLLRKLGYFSLRNAVSGAGQEPIPDVYAFHNNPPQAFAFEVKAWEYKRKPVRIMAWVEKKGKRIPGQIVKCFQWIWGVPDVVKDKRVFVAVKFLLGERCKSPWVLKQVPEPENRDLTKLKDVIVDISSPSDFPELTGPTKSKRSRYIIKKRRERRGS